jgi:hypothetical protein
MDGIGRKAKLGLYRIGAWLKYWSLAVDEHAIHSPFLFDWYTGLRSFNYQDSDLVVDHLRSLQADREILERRDPGMGSSGHISVSKVYRKTRSNFKLRKLIAYLTDGLPHGSNILELGTGLGSSTLVFGQGKGRSVWTIEGDPALADYARRKWLSWGDIYLVEGKFDEVLGDTLKKVEALDLVFLDGDHRSEALSRQIDQIRPYLKEAAVLVVDDIHWSADMERGWKALCSEEWATICVDMFRFGLIFLRPSQGKQEFVLRY